MQRIRTNFSLKEYTSFGVNISSEYYSEPDTIDGIQFLIKYAKERSLDTLIIGEGSNLLFIKNYKGLILHPMIRGIEKIDESDTEVLLRVGAGENWDKFVEYCVNNSWYGVENLSLIPGSVGASPVQNIGAYGCEAKDVVEYVEVFDCNTMQPDVISNAACEFGYRDSIFKHGQKDRYIVSKVVFRLKKQGELKLDYGNIKNEFLKAPKQDLKTLRQTIIAIRENKLPDPEKTGNGGSYFKNPVISSSHFAKLKSRFEAIPSYPASKDMIKVPAGWLIEQAGWKGKREGDAGTWPSQALVICNFGTASGQEIFEFSEKIRIDVEQKFDINLEREVLVIGG